MTVRETGSSQSWPVRLEWEVVRAATGRSQLLDQDLATQMLTPQVPDGFGLGVMVRQTPNNRRYGHDGSNVGYNCFVHVWPDAGEAVAAMVNLDNAREVLRSLLAAAERRNAGQAATPSRPPALPGDLSGGYLLRDDLLVEVAAANGGLTLLVPGQRPVTLVR